MYIYIYIYIYMYSNWMHVHVQVYPRVACGGGDEAPAIRYFECLWVMLHLPFLALKRNCHELCMHESKFVCGYMPGFLATFRSQNLLFCLEWSLVAAFNQTWKVQAVFFKLNCSWQFPFNPLSAANTCISETLVKKFYRLILEFCTVSWKSLNCTDWIMTNWTVIGFLVYFILYNYTVFAVMRSHEYDFRYTYQDAKAGPTHIFLDNYVLVVPSYSGFTCLCVQWTSLFCKFSLKGFIKFYSCTCMAGQVFLFCFFPLTILLLQKHDQLILNN